jgi:protein involved in polysaccharide export with SLBB domain
MRRSKPFSLFTALIALAALGACSWSTATRPFGWAYQGASYVGSGIASVPSGVAGAISGSAQQPLPMALRQYHVLAGDVLEVTLGSTGSVLGMASVDDKGRAMLPLAGRTHVAGLTFGEVARLIEAKHVSDVKVRLRAPPEALVVGEVATPGGVAYTDGLTLAALLTAAGGATHKADLRKIFITPRGEAEQSVEFDPALSILPGDVVRLKQRYF